MPRIVTKTPGSRVKLKPLNPNLTPPEPPRVQQRVRRRSNNPRRAQLRQFLQSEGAARFIRFLINRGFFDDFNTSDPE